MAIIDTTNMDSSIELSDQQAKSVMNMPIISEENNMSLKYEIVYNSNKLQSTITHYRYGQTHRINAPASTWDDGQLFWYQYGNLHRTIRPPIHTKYGYYIEGKLYVT